MTLTLLNNNMFDELPNILTNSIDLVIADLPYCQTNNSWETNINLVSLWSHLKRIGKENCCYVFFCTTKFGYKIIQSNEKWFRYDLVWDKEIPTGFLNSKKQPMRQHEMIYIFYDKLPIYNIQDNHIHKPKQTNKSVQNNSKNYKTDISIQTTGSQWFPKLPTSILKIKKNNYRKKSKHPTEKPIELFEFLIKYYTNKDGKILDICFGSGNSAIAAKNLNRDYIGIELNETYFKLCESNS